MFSPELGSGARNLQGKDQAVGKSVDALPPPERAQRYRELADAAFLKAKHANGDELRAECLRLATGWHAMALELDANLRHLTQLEASRDRLLEPAKETEPDQRL